MSSPPAVVAISAVPTTLVPKSSGCTFGQREDRHAAHRVADQHHRLVAGEVVDDPFEVASELLDRRVAVGRAAERPCERWS